MTRSDGACEKGNKKGNGSDDRKVTTSGYGEQTLMSPKGLQVDNFVPRNLMRIGRPGRSMLGVGIIVIKGVQEVVKNEHVGGRQDVVCEFEVETRFIKPEGYNSTRPFPTLCPLFRLPSLPLDHDRVEFGWHVIFSAVPARLGLEAANMCCSFYPRSESDGFVGTYIDK